MIAPDKPSPRKSSVTDVMGMRPVLQAAKGELRVLMKAQLSRVTAAELEAQSRAVFDALLRLKVYRDARRISVYLSMPRGEVLTESIVRHALAAGKDVFVPYLHRSGARETRRGSWIWSSWMG
jgi:5-formyltetrahydrofolate cyclo-ligase